MSDLTEHEPVARYCVVVDAGIPTTELRDDICCPACDENRTALRLDLDFADEMRDYADPPSCQVNHPLTPEQPPADHGDGSGAGGREGGEGA